MVSALITWGFRIVLSVTSHSPVVDIALQGGGLSSLQHAFGRLEGGDDPSDHLESVDRVEIDPSAMTKVQVPVV